METRLARTKRRADDELTPDASKATLLLDTWATIVKSQKLEYAEKNLPDFYEFTNWLQKLLSVAQAQSVSIQLLVVRYLKKFIATLGRFFKDSNRFASEAEFIQAFNQTVLADTQTLESLSNGCGLLVILSERFGRDKKEVFESAIRNNEFQPKLVLGAFQDIKDVGSTITLQDLTTIVKLCTTYNTGTSFQILQIHFSNRYSRDVISTLITEVDRGYELSVTEDTKLEWSQFFDLLSTSLDFGWHHTMTVLMEENANWNLILKVLTSNNIALYKRLLAAGVNEETMLEIFNSPAEFQFLILRNSQSYVLEQFGEVYKIHFPLISLKNYVKLYKSGMEFYSTLSEEQKTAVRHYGGNVIYGDVNGFLRGKGTHYGTTQAEIDSVFQHLDSVFASPLLPRYDFDILAYRGVDLRGYVGGALLDTDEVLRDPAYKSVSLNLGISLGFCRLAAADYKCLILQIKIPAGTPVFKDARGSENEIILPRTARFVAPSTKGFDIRLPSGQRIFILPVTVVL